jgi:hypothetical protein
MRNDNGILMPDGKENARCWYCQYCDKESELRHGVWVPTNVGYCLAEKSAANGIDSFNERVTNKTVYKRCNLYKEVNINSQNNTQ